MSKYGRSRDRRGRTVRRALAGVIVVVAAWQVYGALHRVNKAAGSQVKVKPAATQQDGADRVVDRDPDDGAGSGAAFGMSPLDMPAPSGPVPVEDVVARGHRVDLLLERAQQCSDSGRVLEQRAALNQALGLMEEGPHAAQVRGTLAAMNIELFLGRGLLPHDPYALMVAIQAGDSYQKIARRFHISSDLVAMLNPEANPRRLRLGAGIKVVQGPFNACIVRNDGRLDLYARDLYVRSYMLHDDDGMLLQAGMYKIRSGGKVAINAPAGSLGGGVLRRLEITAGDGQGLRIGTLYASPTMRTPSTGGAVAGMRVDEADMAQLFATLGEESTIRVEE